MNEEEKKAVEILNTFEFRRKTRNYKIISLEDSKSVKNSFKFTRQTTRRE